MPKSSGRRPPFGPAGRRRTANGALVARLLEQPALVSQVRALPAPVVRRAIQQIGLEDAGELVTLLADAQLRELFDEDLWHAIAPGEDEQFDPARFALWLEILLEGGAATVADRVAGLEEELRVAAFSQLVRVFEVAELEATASDADEADQLDKLLDARLAQELGEHLLVARIEDGWDAVWETLLALDERHPDLLATVLDRCAHATREETEREGGVTAVLRGDAQLLEDARGDRDERRAARGYVSPADARAFLALAATEATRPGHDPITQAYFREWSREPVGAASSAAPRARDDVGLLALLAEAGADVVPREAVDEVPASALRDAMAALAEIAPERHASVMEELAFLANVLVAGDRTRRWEHADAAAEVMARCERGLELLVAREGPPVSDRLAAWGAVGAFRVATAAGRS